MRKTDHFFCSVTRGKVKNQHLIRTDFFTMAEMVVVMAVAVLIATLLLPSIQTARSNGQRTLCLQNLKRLSMATDLYVSGNSGYLPMGIGSAGAWDQQLLAAGLVAATCRNQGSFLDCPANSGRRGGTNFINYGWSAYLGDTEMSPDKMEKRWRQAVKRADIGRPADIIVAGDGTFKGIKRARNGQEFREIWTTKTWFREREAMAIHSFIHRGRLNYLFADGHADSIPLFDPRLTSNPAHAPWSNFWLEKPGMASQTFF